MARSPFQGTFQPNLRPTVVTAPDALVYINGEQDVLGCPSCKRKFDLSKYITSIQVNLDIDSVPGSATVSLSIPRHTVDDFFFDGVPVISPMMEVEIFAKGFYLLEGIPQYYPVFWGLVTEVSDSYSGGEHTVTINCADILKWWDICRLNINPAFLGQTPQLGKSLSGNVLFGTNPYDVIFTLAQMAFGDVIVATGSLKSLVQEQKQQQTFTAALSDIMVYWESRFARIRSSLVLYGVSGVAVRGDSLAETYKSGKLNEVKNFVCSSIRNGNPVEGPFGFDPAGENVTAFRDDYGQIGEGVTNFWQNDYQTKLEIANQCKEAIGFEFYMDVTGDIVFKPPFYNLDILSNKPVSWVQDIDIIDWDFSESEADVVTQLTMQGGFFGNKEYGAPAELTPYTSVTDYHLLRKYGWRSQPYPSEFLGDNLQKMYFHGLDVLDRINSRRHSATITIPFRPELRLGFPIYVAPKDQVWYIKGISHNISFGSRATTTLTLTARRGKFIGIKGMGTLKPKNKDSFAKTDSSKQMVSAREAASSGFELDVGNAGFIPAINLDPQDSNSLTPYEPLVLRHPKTGRIVGFPNVVMVYSRPYEGEYFTNASGIKAPGTNAQVPKKDQARVAKNQETNLQELGEQQVDRISQLQNKYAHNRFTYGLNSSGVYLYAYDQSKFISQMTLLPQKNIKVIQDGATVALLEDDPSLTSPTTMVRPVSDDRGFEVIGHYRYGRGISLRDGALIVNEPNKRVGNGGSVKGSLGETQLALSGDLFATLTAQSQGVTTQTSVYPNPSDAIARLQPEDLQTAAALVPDQVLGTKPQFVDTESSFVDTATLGSMEQQGAPTSVEASQLSRALTLAEMTVKFGEVPGDPNCECQLGRADLAFINYGYQTNLLTGSTPDSTLTEDEFNAALSAFDKAQGNTTQFGVDAITSASSSYVKPANLKGGAELTSRVESYLWNLYSALDEAHQPVENALRGDPNGVEPSTQTLPDLFSTPDDQSVAGVAPPFSALNRAAVGDPLATAKMGKSSLDAMQNSLKNFSSDLRKTTKAKKAGVELTNLRSKADRLRKRISDAQNPQIHSTDDVGELQRELAQTEQDIAQKEGGLAQLTG